VSQLATVTRGGDRGGENASRRPAISPRGTKRIESAARPPPRRHLSEFFWGSGRAVEKGDPAFLTRGHLSTKFLGSSGPQRGTPCSILSRSPASVLAHYAADYQGERIGEWRVPECDAARWLLANGKAARSDVLERAVWAMRSSANKSPPIPSSQH
jgi:hypothetical protein